MNEKITLLMANYNNGQYIEEAIQSILQQDCNLWELLIADDKSTDSSVDIYQRYEDHPQIQVIYNEKNIGYINTLKRLIENAQTDIVGIIDPDDKLDSSTVRKILKYYANHTKAGFVYTNFWFCDGYLNPTNIGFSKPIHPKSSNLIRNCVSAFRTFRKSYYYKTEGLDEQLLYAEDKDLYFKFEEITHLHIINEPLYYYRVLPNSQGHGNKGKIGYKNFQLAKKKAYCRRYVKNWNGKISFFNELQIFYFRYKLKKNKKIKVDKEVLADNLISAKQILDRLNMKNWLTDGTLLGYYRENKILDHDLDADLGCFIKEYDDRLLREFLNHGWYCEHIFGTPEVGLEFSFKRNDAKVDIFFFYEEDGKFWHAAWKNTRRGQQLIKYYYDPFTLKEIEFLGSSFNIPADTEHYIVTKYGKDWRIPKTKWDWAFDPANAVPTHFYNNRWK